VAAVTLCPLKTLGRGTQMRKLSIAAALLTAVQASASWSQAAAEPPKILVDGYGEVQTMPIWPSSLITFAAKGRRATMPCGP